MANARQNDRPLWPFLVLLLTTNFAVWAFFFYLGWAAYEAWIQPFV